MPKRIVFISHNASRTGAPIALLHLLRWLRSNTNLSIEILLKQGGELEDEFRSIAETHVLSDVTTVPLSVAAPLNAGLRRMRLRNIREKVNRKGIDLVYSNTITNGDVIGSLFSEQQRLLTHVHELEFCIQHQARPIDLTVTTRRTDSYLAASNAVRNALVRNLGISPDRVEVVYEFISIDKVATMDHAQVGAQTREELGIPPDAFVVGGCGDPGWRKGPDLFIQLAAVLQRRLPNLDPYFVWVGARQGRQRDELLYDVDRAGLGNRIRLLGTLPDPMKYFSAFDAFALVSREDPFPLVCLEAAAACKPILCFDNAGGAKEFVGDDCGFVVPYLSVQDMADKVVQLIQSPELRSELGRNAWAKVSRAHTTENVAPQILGKIEALL